MPGLDPHDEPLDVLGGGEVFAERLANRDGDRERVAAREPQQRPPVQVVTVGWGVGGVVADHSVRELEAFAHRHRRQLDAHGEPSEPGVLGAPRREQHPRAGAS